MVIVFIVTMISGMIITLKTVFNDDGHDDDHFGGHDDGHDYG
jgi:hypothetical protein